MNITYIAKISGTPGSGVNKKIAAQIKAWRKLGHTVRPIFVLYLGELPLELQDFDAEVVRQESIFSKFIKDRSLENAVIKSKPDIVYFRMANLPFLSVTNIFNYSVVLEINTIIYEELRISYSGVKYLLLKLHFKNILKKSTAYVGVTKECILKLPNKPSIQVGNSIDFDEKLYEEVRRQKDKSNICVFVGNGNAPWHGTDRLMSIANNNLDYKFWVIGSTKETMEDKIKTKLPENVEFLGLLTGKKYDNALRIANIAFGSLAMDRNKMRYSSSLKNRDYLQYALPIIMQGVDSDLKHLLCVKSIPMDFSQKDVTEALESLSKDNFFDSVDSVIEAISTERKEKKRVAFLESLLY